MKQDIIIIGTGAGGGALAYALRNSGARVLIVERGDFLPVEDENWDSTAIFKEGRYKTSETWTDGKGYHFRPGVHYYVGGNTKVFGAAFPRLRKEDFEDLEHEGGTSPGWPISYDDLEPYYAEAERLFRVHGTAGSDPTDAPRSGDYPFPALPHEPYVADLIERLSAQGLHPYDMPMGVDRRDGGACIRCQTCDGYPCKVGAKSDVEMCCVRPALESEDVRMMTGARAVRLIEQGGRIEGVEIEHQGETKTLTADTYVVACGAVNSAALLIRSGDGTTGGALANSSGLVGRNYMVHNNTALMAVDPRRKNPTIFQKTMAVNDFYFSGPGFAYPMGNLQIIGKLQAGMLTAAQPLVPKPLLQAMANRSIDWWVMSEDLPDPENHVSLTSSGEIQINWTPNNLVAHRRLTESARKMMKAAGYPLVLVKPMGIETNSHQCGTMRFGADPAHSVLDTFCRSHDITNLFVMDSSFFPSSTAVNPALTIIAQALRVGKHMASC